MTFDRKMKWFISIAIVSSATLILIISTYSAITSVTKKSRDLAQMQINAFSNDLENTLETYKETALALALDGNVQSYLKSEPRSHEYQIRSEGAKETLVNIQNLQIHTNFLAVAALDDKGNLQDETGTNYLFKAQESMISTRFQEIYTKDYRNSFPSGYGTMRMNFNNAYYNGEKYTLNIYYPVYNTYKIGNQIGLICINVDENIFRHIFEKTDSIMDVEICLINTEGTLVTHADKEKIGKQVDYLAQLTDDHGSFEQNGSLYVYQKIGRWNYYLVDIIPTSELYRDSLQTVYLLIVLLVAMVAVSLLVASKIISRNYEPLDELVTKMGQVSEGRLDIRIEEAQMGADFKQMASGFNVMMDKIVVLMDQVKEEQHQVEQIRFNALQSQIQPHFLYNTLECIHWQAAAKGDKQVSTLVKALAMYYRLCLSKGHDVINLSQEIEHVKNYLTIQNIRYDHILDAVFEVPPGMNEIQIPKMTLQPLVENAIYHGIKLKKGIQGELRIYAYMEEEDAIVCVEDSGSGMSQDRIDDMNNSISVYDESFGYGVRNVNKRIEILFGKRYGLYYMANEKNGITVQIRLPRDGNAEYKGIL